MNDHAMIKKQQSDDLSESNLTSLMSAAGHLKTKEEKMLYYLSVIAASSALFTRLTGIYNQHKVYPNLYLIVSAPPASGKGIVMSARTLLKPVHIHFKNESSNALDHIKMKTSTIKIGNATAAQTNKPKFCIVFVPGNCSSSKLIQHLAENDPHVPTLIIEAEIDTLSRANRSEFGGFSDLLRKAFHNEPVSYTRKLNNEFIEVEQPKLSVVLSGTPDQIQRLIGTPSDGLYSRFIFYSFNGKSEWEDVSNKKDLNFSDLLVQQSEQYFKLWEFYSDRDVHFDLTAKQWELLNNMFRSELEAVAKGTNIYAQGIVKRHGLIFFKMCVTLTAMRYFEMNDSSDQIYCSDEDFHFAKDLVLVALDSSLDLLDTFPQTSNHVNFGKRKKTIEFSKALPESFVRADAIQIGQGLDIPSARVDRWLRTLIDKGILESVKFGYYQKVGDDKNPT